MTSGRMTKLPPWKKPWSLACFFLALIFSAYLMLHMPESSTSTHISGAMPKATKSSENSSVIASQKQPSLTQNDLMQETDKVSKKNEATQEKSSWEKFTTKLQSFTRIFTMVGLAAFLGAVIELRCWHRFLAHIMGKLSHLARLPEIVGLALPTALVSTAAAHTMLASSHKEGRIGTSALIAGGMANSYVSYIAHSIRVIIPVVATIGLPGILFFVVQFSGGLFVILAVFAWNRWHVDHHTNHTYPKHAQHTPFIIKPWAETLRQAVLRSLALLFRLICITVPLTLSLEWLLKIGAFDFWNTLVPAHVQKFFPAEAISIVAMQIGGLIQSSTVAANLRSEGLIDNAQILLAMLVASAVGNPIRTLRRNLPTALAIFPAKIGGIIVFTMQFSRIIVAMLGAGITIAYMQTL